MEQWNMQQLREYISFVKHNVQPDLSAEAKCILVFDNTVFVLSPFISDYILCMYVCMYVCRCGIINSNVKAMTDNPLERLCDC